MASWQGWCTNGLLRITAKKKWRVDMSLESIRAQVHWADAKDRGGLNGIKIRSVGDGFQGHWIVAPDSRVDRVILYLHGGAFCLHMPHTYRRFCADLARRAQARVLLVDYGLAPENPFPAGLYDCLRAYRWLLEQGVGADRIAVAGDSAGGNLTLSLLLQLRDGGEPLPACAAALSAATDLEFRSPSLQTHEARDVMFTQDSVDFLRTHYIASNDAADPRLSPLNAELEGLPDLLIHASNTEMLVDDSRRFAEKAQAAGVGVQLEFWDGMPHVFQLMPWLPESREARARIARFILQRIS